MNAREQAQLRDELARRRLERQTAAPRWIEQVEEFAAEQKPPVSGIARYKALTPRQREAAELWADGLSLRAIAGRLGCAPNGAAQAVRAARHKLEVPALRPTLARAVLRYALEREAA